MRFWARIDLKNEKGNAMLMALSVIFILTSFATVSLMTSVANAQMSAKYKNWSNDYSVLDNDSETKVNQINSSLVDAETYAQNYMAGQYYLSPDSPSGDLQVSTLAQSYINGNWNGLVGQYLPDMKSPDYQEKQPVFMADALKRLYFYYAAKSLHDAGFTLQLNDSAILVSDYQDALFDGSEPQILSDGSLAVKLNSTRDEKTMTVKLDILFPSYSTLPQMKVVKFKGNPIWTNAITAAGSIGFENGSSTIKGDLFSADKDESLYLDDTKVYDYGIYSDGADVDIYGNVYSKGNLHIVRSGSSINVSAYPPGFPTVLKNKVFSDNGLFFDNSDSATYRTDYPYIQTDPLDDAPLYFVNQDINGGNIYCNSLTVDHTVDNQRVDNGIINAHGNVSTFNDIKMNNTIPGSIADGSGSKISVSKNFIGINSSGHNGDPNANSTVINNTALAGNTITLNGKIIVPGTAWAEYKGVKKNGWTRFFWPSSTNPKPLDKWVSQQYYQTGESITAKNADIYSAYMSPVINQDPLYNYSYEPFTLDTNPQDRVPAESYADVEDTINAFYLMRGDNKAGEIDNIDQDSLIPKKSQLVDYLVSNIPVVSNIYTGPTLKGYALAEALLHSNDELVATVFGNNLPDDPVNRLKQIIDLPSAHGYFDYYNYFQSFLSTIFLSKVQNLGTINRLPISFENFIDKSDGYIGSSSVENFVNKSTVLDITGSLFTGISSNPIGKLNSFSYLQSIAGSDLNFSGDYSGIIYCEGDLNITGSGTFNGAIICEGNVTVVGVTIAYDKEVIQEVMESDDVAYNFFSKLICFENPADKSKGFVDKAAIFESNGSLRMGINSDPIGMNNRFVYLQPLTGIDTSTLDIPDDSSYSGILYCEGNLTITGNGTFDGAIICEGNVKVSGNLTITYNEEVIKSVMRLDGKARSFFTKGSMGLDNDISYQTTAYDGAVRQANVRRFQIVEWKEEQL